MKKAAKLLSLMLILCLLAGLFIGCGGGDTKDTEIGSDTASGTGSSGTKDSSDDGEIAEAGYVPTKEISPRAWFTWADTFAPPKRPVEDVVGEEIRRITKVHYTQDSIIANNGVTGPERLNMFIATDELPEIIYAQVSSSTDIINKLIEAEKVWELTPYLEEYCPNILQRVLQETWDCWKRDGKIFGIPGDFGASLLYEPNMTDLAKEQIAEKPSPFFLGVRDDLLKAVYPETKNTEELKAALEANGRLTYEDMKTPIETPDDLLYFLREVKKMNVKTQGKDVIPLDMWTEGWWIAPFAEAYGFVNSCAWGVTWSDETSSVYFAPATPEYKEYLYWLHTAYKEKLMDQETFVFSDDQRNAKINAGLYAVTHNWQDFNGINSNIEKNGDTFKYRLMKAMTKKINGDPQYWMEDPRGGNFLMISKNVPEADMIQLLNWIDFMYSYEGEELMAWGPESAGLWEYRNGVKTFKDEALMRNAMYGTETEKDLSYYGLAGGPINFYELARFTYMHTNTRGVRAYHEVPPVVDDIIGAQYGDFWSETFSRETRTSPIFMFLGQVPDIAKLTSEEGLYGCVKNEWAEAIIAENDEGFEHYYQEGLKRLQDLGMEKALSDLTNIVNDFLASQN
jgi:putative aldouronate transport system substrate-binding protein